VATKANKQSTAEPAPRRPTSLNLFFGVVRFFTGR
jgi:hypothetical protein